MANERGRWLPRQRQQGTPVAMGRTYIRPDRDNTQYGYINTTNRSKTENRHDWTFAYELSGGPAQAALTNPTGCRNA